MATTVVSPIDNDNTTLNCLSNIYDFILHNITRHGEAQQAQTTVAIVAFNRCVTWECATESLQSIITSTEYQRLIDSTLRLFFYNNTRKTQAFEKKKHNWENHEFWYKYNIHNIERQLATTAWLKNAGMLLTTAAPKLQHMVQQLKHSAYLTNKAFLTKMLLQLETQAAAYIRTALDKSMPNITRWPPPWQTPSRRLIECYEPLVEEEIACEQTETYTTQRKATEHMLQWPWQNPTATWTWMLTTQHSPTKKNMSD